MKQAGQKNQSAWFRNNKKIKKQQANDPGTAQDLAAEIAAIPSISDAYAALSDMAIQAGISLGDDTLVPASSDDWASTFATKGIPYQVWSGELSFDTYLPPGSDGNPKAYYVKKHGEAFRQFAIDLRLVVTRFFRTRRALADLRNVRTRAQGNPSGVADATKGT